MSPGGSLRGVQAWLARQPEPVDLELVCSEHPAPAVGDPRRTVVRLGSCAGVLLRHELLELLHLGAGTVLVRLDGCADAGGAESHLEPLLEVVRAGGSDRLTLERAGDLPVPATPPGAAVRRRRRARRRPLLDAAHMPVSRRQVLGLGSGTRRDLPAEYVHPHLRTVEGLRALVPAGAPALAEVRSPAVRLAAPGCTACGVCVRACPSDALRVQHSGRDGGAVSTLIQDPSACDGCLRCVDLCPSDVLAAVGSRPWSEVLDGVESPVTTLATARCGRCRTRFPTTTGAPLCPVCAYRREHPFGSALPPAPAPAGAGRL